MSKKFITLVFEYDPAEVSVNPSNIETVFGLPVTTYDGHAVADLEQAENELDDTRYELLEDR